MPTNSKTSGPDHAPVPNDAAPSVWRKVAVDMPNPEGGVDRHEFECKGPFPAERVADWIAGLLPKGANGAGGEIRLFAAGGASSSSASAVGSAGNAANGDAKRKDDKTSHKK